MFKYLKKTILFLLGLALFFLFNIGLNSLILSESFPSVNVHRTLVLGDSHAKYDINPQLLDDAINVAQTGENYIVSYWKLKYFLKEFHPETIILGYSPHNISRFNDYKFIDDEWSEEMFKRTYAIEDFDKDTVDFDNTTYWKVYFKRMAFFPRKNHFEFVGKYEKDERNNISDSLLAIGRHYYTYGEYIGLSKQSIDFLNKIIALCAQNNIKLILVEGKTHTAYSSRIPPSILINYNKLKLKLLKQQDIRFYENLDQFEDELFLDSNHLNYKGSLKFTSGLREFMVKEKLN
jgi:hypothetical protein